MLSAPTAPHRMLGALLVLGLLISLQLWSQARRKRGEEASSSNASGADVFFDANFPTGT